MAGYLSVDRIESGIAVLERDDRTSIRIPLTELPENVREGDCLREQDGGFVIDAGETARRREENQSLFRTLTGRT